MTPLQDTQALNVPLSNSGNRATGMRNAQACACPPNRTSRSRQSRSTSKRLKSPADRPEPSPARKCLMVLFLGAVAAFPTKEEHTVKVTLLDTTLANVYKSLGMSLNTLTAGDRTDNTGSVGIGGEPGDGRRIEDRRGMEQVDRGPARRQSETLRIDVDGQTFHVTFGCYEDGRIGEIFITSPKASQTFAAIQAADAAVDLHARDVHRDTAGRRNRLGVARHHQDHVALVGRAEANGVVDGRERGVGPLAAAGCKVHFVGRARVLQGWRQRHAGQIGRAHV